MPFAVLANSDGVSRPNCSDPRKLDRSQLEFFALVSLLVKERKDEGIEVLGRAKGVHLKTCDYGVPVTEIYRKAGISQATSFRFEVRFASNRIC